jgi:putative tryptophan/tyrosine transport system substrate-binding protein
MRRREFVLLGGAAVASPFIARAQQTGTLPRVALVSTGANPSDPVVFLPFIEQMRELGYVDGQSIVFERRFAGGRVELIQGFIADVVHRAVDIIVVTGTRETFAAKQATSSIPIVMLVHPNPVAAGLASSLARPGGNVTGLTDADWGLYGKRLELLKEAVPGLQKAGLLVSRTNLVYKRDSGWARDTQAAAQSLGIALDLLEFDADDVDATIAAAVKGGVQAVAGAADGVVIARRTAIADSAIKHRLPTIFAFRQNVEAGGFLSYAGRVSELSRRAAFFVDRILKGAKPADLPIEQPTTFEFWINLRTAKALGLTVPPQLLARADEVIE